jgi:hypothetical protein
MGLAFLLMAALDCACPEAAAEASRKGMAAHLERNLGAASRHYDEALRLAPPRDPTPAERELILKLAPRLYTVKGEPFPLKDAAAVMHPTEPWIAYHLFWEDDIDFPNDNDPCDHEVVWVRHGPQSEAVFTYYHARILKGGSRIDVQWGKHGSLPEGWRQMPEVVADQRRTWERLSTKGRQDADSPLARGWPLKFTGSWEEFTRFDVPVDLAAALRKGGLMAVSCLNNAVINRRFLRYNFAAKTEWPEELCTRPTR